MTDSGRSFDPNELCGGEGGEPTDAELSSAWSVARELGAMGAGAPAPVNPEFVSRVMAAIEQEPVPRPVIAAGRAARQLRPVGILVSLRDAWRVAFGPGRTMGARAGALAYVLIAFVVLGSFTGAAVVGTATLLAPVATQTPVPTLPVAQPSAPSDLRSASPAAPPSGTTEVPGPSEAPEASHDPGSSEAPNGTGAPAFSPEPGRTSSPATTPEPSSSPDDNPHTPKPSLSPAPSTQPTGTPRPTSSGGDGGGDGESSMPSSSPSPG